MQIKLWLLIAGHIGGGVLMAVGMFTGAPFAQSVPSFYASDPFHAWLTLLGGVLVVGCAAVYALHVRPKG